MRFNQRISMASAALAASLTSARDLTVNTSTGTATGFVDASIPGVKQWLGIPFAEPPVDSLRFLPPVAKSYAGFVNATAPPASCQQYLTTKPTVFNTFVPEFLPPDPYSEDCLYLNVIAPQSPPRSDEALPVVVWSHGGETTYGGINTPYERPHQWVQRSQQHMVVMINYRMNIFGFPNARALNTTALGLLDQRLALEWVRTNIAKFGGDPAKITIWGQSAGGALAEAHQFAFPSDPIFRAGIQESGFALQAMTNTDLNKTSFSYVAAAMGCPSSPAEELACMRKVDAGKIETFIQQHVDSGAKPTLFFSVQADEKLIYLPQEILARADAGQFANVPLILGSNAMEASSLITPFEANGSDTTPALIHQGTLAEFQCKISTECKYRQASGRTTFRYFYGGNFSNISPAPFLGAYHFSELPLTMGTHSNYRSKSTPLEFALSERMQDLWLAFVKDPVSALPSMGWYSYSNGTAKLFGVNGTLEGTEDVATLDKECAAAS